MTGRREQTLIGIFVKALFPRFLFLGHGMMCTWLIVQQQQNPQYWYLVLCLGLIVLEGIFNALVRHGKEFHWFCPSAFLYCVVLIITMTLLREGQLGCLKDIKFCQRKLGGNDALTNLFNRWSYELRASIMEQSGLLVLIIGRWLLPQGRITREQFSQILLIYIGTAADIVEFSEIYGEDDVKKLSKDTENVLHGVMAVWALSVIQFSLTIALPEDGLKQEEDDEEEEEDEDEFAEASYFRSRMQNKVAPMSYMHYKSMLRECFQNENGTVKNVRNPTEAQIEFRQKYENTSKTISSLRISSQTMDKEAIYRSETSSPRSAKYTYSPKGIKSKSAISLPRDSASPRVTLPHGERIPQNIGSPTNSRSTRTASNSRSNRNISSPQSVRSLKMMPSPQTSDTSKNPKDSMNSNKKQNNFSTTGKITNMKKGAWGRFVDIMSYKKKRRQDVGRERKDSTKEDNSLGIGKKEVQGCFIKYLDLIGILLPVCMQDGPFFILRFVLIVHYQVVTEMIFLLTTKNALVIIVQIYRILLMYCSEPKNEPDIDDPSVRVRTAMNTNKKLSERGGSFRNRRASIAVQAVSRMQASLAQARAEENRRVSETMQNGKGNDYVALQLN